MSTFLRPKIITLPPQVADRIQAGEVVERPSAVVKELVENALDAGADDLTIVIEEAGRTLIKVIDNGIGMSESDMTASIGRHATSKLARFEDLESLTSFGFRGEALPSIAAVSKLEMISRVQGDEVGNRLKISGGKIDALEPIAAPQGTSIAVSHLFYNVPARRKFLRTDSTEFKWISMVFRYFALGFPAVSFKLFHHNKVVYDLPAADNPLIRLSGMFGDDVAEDLVEINHTYNWMTVRGWISPPSMVQRTRDTQYLFMNRRPIEHQRIAYQIAQAWQPYNITGGGHPLFVAFLEADPDRYDINVHPAKKEIKFADEKGATETVWHAVRDALRESRLPTELSQQPNLGQARGAESAFSDTQSSPHSHRGEMTTQSIPIPSPGHLKPYTSVPRQYGASRTPIMPFNRNSTSNIEADNSMSSSAAPLFDPEQSESPGLPVFDEEGPTVWQVFDTYIVSPLKNGLVFIDQHIAHERILYERALNAINNSPWNSQQLLFPTTFSVDPEDVSMVEQALPLLRAMGFEIQNTGSREYKILAVPTGVRISHERDMLLEIIAEFRESNTAESDPRNILAASFACRGAVKAGQPLKTEEMRRLIDELFRTEDPEFCPHGRPIYHILPVKEIEKWFKR